MKNLIAIATTSLCLMGSAQAADNFTLTFDQNTACGNTACSNWGQLSQNYGDVAGLVDVSYINVNNPQYSLLSWDLNYNDLSGVAWTGGGAGDSDAVSHGRIEIKAPNGGMVVLNSMDFGAWSNTTRGTHIVVTALGGGSPLFSYTGDVGSGTSSHNTFSPNVSSANGLWIDWYNSAYNVGIDNVNFSIAAVPEPETYAMFLAGLGLLGSIARRRKQK